MKINARLMLGITIVIALCLWGNQTGIAQGTLSRDVTYNNYNLSKLPPGMKMPLLTDNKTGVVMGIFRGESPKGVVLMGSNGPISKGSGVFLGSKDKMYKKELYAVIIRADGEGFTKITDNVRIGGVYFEGLIQDPIKVDNSEKCVVKPTAGIISMLSIDGKSIQLSDTDLSHAQIKTAEGKQYEILFLSSVKGQLCYLIEQEPK
jgi:hypothetical protein